MDFYENPQREIYYFPSAAFGATTDSMRVVGPKGKKGYVRDIWLDPTANMVGTTSVPEINVGTASGDFTYARFRLGTTAILGYTSAAGVRRASQVGGNTLTDGTPAFEDFAGHVKLATAPIPPDTPFVISRIQGVGGAPAGTAAVYVQVDWF